MIGISNTVARLGLGALSEVVGKRGRLFLYNTCLVICGLTMAFSNYFQPMMAAMAELECQNETLTTIVNTTTSSTMCGQYNHAQLVLLPPITWSYLLQVEFWYELLSLSLTLYKHTFYICTT